MKEPEEEIVMMPASGCDWAMAIAETVMDVVASTSNLKLRSPRGRDVFLESRGARPATAEDKPPSL